MHRPYPPSILLTVTVAIAALLALAPSRASAQEFPTASKDMDISAFGGYENLDPSYYSAPRDSGLLLGADLTRYIGHWPVAPSVELRANFAGGPTVNEHSYLFGLRAQGHVFRRYYPYADVLVGLGSIYYNHPTIPGYTHDNSIVFSFGGGVDIDLIHNFQAKLDIQGQHWNLGTGNDSDILTPSVISIGLAYRIPFKPHFAQKYNHQ
jgi:hypothetical protein